jgi:outer membrane protein assembly factor BamB
MQFGSRLGKYLALGIVAATCGIAPSALADWAQFQGPSRNGVSPETGLARAWSEGQPRALWSAHVEDGFAGPAIRDGEVYILDRVDDKQDVLRCLSFNTGEELWRYAYDAPGKVGHSGSRTTPTVTETHVFTVGMMGHFYCFDRKAHEPVWHKNLLKDFDHESKPRWGFSQSPSLYKDLVVVAPQSSDAYVAAFKQATGELVWASESLGLYGYSTPLVTNLCGVDQAVMIGARSKDWSHTGLVAGLSMEDGSVLWSYDGWQCWIPIPYATPLPGNRLFLTGGYKAGSAMIRLSRNSESFSVEELFTTDRCGSQIHQPLFYKGHLYVNSNSNERTDGMMCLSLDGDILWNTSGTAGLPTFERGNLLLADNMIISLDGKTGALHLLEPSPEGYKELAGATLFQSREMWSPMALTDGKLVLRSWNEMRCVDLRNP